MIKDIIAQAASKASQGNDTAAQPAAEKTALDRRYGQIGISAVAAAARYQGGAKNPAYAPAPLKWREWNEEAA